MQIIVWIKNTAKNIEIIAFLEKYNRDHFDCDQVYSASSLGVESRYDSRVSS
jgi:hypothetical protein